MLLLGMSRKKWISKNPFIFSVSCCFHTIPKAGKFIKNKDILLIVGEAENLVSRSFQGITQWGCKFWVYSSLFLLTELQIPTWGPDLITSSSHIYFLESWLPDKTSYWIWDCCQNMSIWSHSSYNILQGCRGRRTSVSPIFSGSHTIYFFKKTVQYSIQIETTPLLTSTG